MPNTILNDPSAANNAATYSAQARPDKGDVDAWIAGFANSGIVSGAQVTSSGSMGLSVAAGTVMLGGVQYVVSGASLTVATADPANPRTDLVVWDSSAGYELIAGTAAVTPSWPSYTPASQVLLAMVVVPAAASAVSSGNIVDKRIVLPPLPRQSSAHTTASLAGGAQEQSSITLAKSYRLLSVTISAAARVRLYDRAAKQAADSARVVGTKPTGDHGLMYEFVGTTTLLSCDVSPPAIGSSMETTPVTAIPLTVDNLTGATQAITVTFVFFAEE